MIDTYPHSNQIGEYVYLIYKEFNYPEFAYKNRVEGSVLIAIELDKDGIPVKSEILKDVGAGLGKEALRLTNLLNVKWDIPDTNHYRIIIPIKFAIK